MLNLNILIVSNGNVYVVESYLIQKRNVVNMHLELIGNMIKDQEYCPYGHKDIEHTTMAYSYIYCHTCKKRFTQGDYPKEDE